MVSYLLLAIQDMILSMTRDKWWKFVSKNCMFYVVSAYLGLLEREMYNVILPNPVNFVLPLI